MKSYKWDQVKIFDLPIIKDLIDPMSLGRKGNKLLFTQNELNYALILTFHPSVLRDIQYVINKLKLQQFLSYPENRNITSLGNILNDLKHTQQAVLDVEVDKLLKKYTLSENWKFSLKLKILTNVLPIPYRDLPIVITQRNFDDNSYPTIIIKENISKNQLKEWIDNEWDTSLQPALDKLPSIEFTKTSASALALGLVFDAISGENKDWKKIEDLISQIEEIDEQFFSKNSEAAPDRTELLKLIPASKRILHSFYPIDPE